MLGCNAPPDYDRSDFLNCSGDYSSSLLIDELPKPLTLYIVTVCHGLPALLEETPQNCLCYIIFLDSGFCPEFFGDLLLL